MAINIFWKRPLNRRSLVNLQKSDLNLDGFGNFMERAFIFVNFKLVHGHRDKQAQSMNLVRINEIINSHSEK